MALFQSLVGKRYGRLLVLRRVEDFTYKGGGRQVGYLCRCECGVEKSINAGALRDDQVKSCGCLRSEMLTNKNIKEPFVALYNRFVAQANRSNHRVGITYEQFVKFTVVLNCHYCSARVIWSRTKEKGKPFGYNLDRVDARKGYTKKNCVVCCARCNRSKSDSFSYAEWVEVGKAIRAFREGNKWQSQTL